MSNTYDNAEKAIDTHLTQTLTRRQRKAIRVCNADLYSGPYYSKNDRSRWEIWAPILDKLCDALPSELWYNACFDEVLDSEPKAEEAECMECDGGSDTCQVCEGSGVDWFEPPWDDFYHFDARAIKRVVLGHELASYF